MSRPTRPIATLLATLLYSALFLTSQHLFGFEGVQPGVDPLRNEAALDYSGPQSLFRDNCQVCHGPDLLGTAQGVPLLGVALKRGDAVEQLVSTIASGAREKGMPAFDSILSRDELKQLAIYILERRYDFAPDGYGLDNVPITLPTGALTSELLDYCLDAVTSEIDPNPFSIAPMPDGRILLSEKTKGLRFVGPEGKLNSYIEGLPKVYDLDESPPGSLALGTGWMQEVALHPDYIDNGWVYLSYGERCNACNEESKKEGAPVSMTKLVRGRIVDGKWQDQQTIWSATTDSYSSIHDTVLGARVAFDTGGFVYISVGMKGGYFSGIQDLGKPFGKVHRVHDNGLTPNDNPFVGIPGALKSIWTYGHRNPQGLEFDPVGQRLWSTEHGPRGGDEVNLLTAGKNYGWPLHSLGVNYEGTPVNYGPELGLEVDLSTIEMPVADFTPSPGLSSFVVYRGGAFPEWEGNLIVGSLKAKELYRLKTRGEQIVSKELLLEGVARIRDVEIDYQGAILLLMEDTSGGLIARITPAPCD